MSVLVQLGRLQCPSRDVLLAVDIDRVCLITRVVRFPSTCASSASFLCIHCLSVSVDLLIY
eukprot:m.31257 g.31257  ORF g.31257 m.31257 type:complete len:61 (-) comp10678_c1_seq1:257-439(-)